MATGPNLLTASQSDFEDGTVGGWGNWTNATVTNTTTQANTGTHSLSIAAIATADTAVFITNIPVVGGSTYRQSCWFRPATTARSCSVYLQFYDNTSTQVGPNNVATVTDTAGVWTQLSQTWTAPPTAVTARIGPYIAAVPAGEVHYMDTVYLQLSGVTPAWKDWRAGTTPGLTQTTIRERTLAALATYVTGTNPDGTTKGS